MKAYNRRAFNRAVGYDVEFVQDNHSRSTQGVCGDCITSCPPTRRGSSCVSRRGRVFDVAVDILEAARALEMVGVELSAENHRQLWFPGFAHGSCAERERRFSVQDDGVLRTQAESAVRWMNRRSAYAGHCPLHRANLVEEGWRRPWPARAGVFTEP